MKKILMTLAAVACCAISVTVGLTSCSQSDNPVESQPQEQEKQVAMADVVTMNGARQSLYKLDTKEVLPFYIAVNSAYKDEKGETQFYDLSTITDVKVNDDMFLVDATHLADNGYIKLTPDPNSQEFKELLEDIEFVEAPWWNTDVKIELTNNRGEKLEQKLPLVYYPKNEQKEVLNIKLADLNENNEIVLEPEIIKQFNLSDWPNQRKGDYTVKLLGDLRDATITDDGKLIVRTWGGVTEPDDENKLTLIFTRSLTGSPHPMLPEGEGLMINFRYELELNVTESGLDAEVLAFAPLLQWGCSIADVEQHIKSKEWWQDGNDKLEYWEDPFQSWHKWYWVDADNQITEQYLFETEDGQNLRYAYCVCWNNTVPTEKFKNTLVRQGFHATGVMVDFDGETLERYLSADGKTEALYNTDAEGYSQAIYRPVGE